MSEYVITVEGLGKKYLLRHLRQEQERHGYTALRDVLAERARRLIRFRQRSNPPSTEEFWALKDVSFQIKQGESVGIIGRNGAGKSTLLKIISRIVEPTQGRIRLKGRVTSLLEVGTGFHKELTGRENIYLNGAILGMTKVEIKRKFDEIVEFAEVDQFLDTAVKHYSNGMYMRLAFAVASHLEPEILVLDEVLAVGDAAFQKKCLGKMQEVGRQGRTILFVSHNMQSISSLTTTTLLLTSGTIYTRGSTDAVVAAYLAQMQTGNSSYEADSHPDHPNVTKVEVVTSQPGQVQICGQKIQFRFEIWSPRPIKNAWFSFRILNQQTQSIVHMWISDSEMPICRTGGKCLLVCDIPRFSLYLGNYTLTTYLSEPPGGQLFECVESICPFEVAMYGMKREFAWQPGACAYLQEGHWHAE